MAISQSIKNLENIEFNGLDQDDDQLCNIRVSRCGNVKNIKNCKTYKNFAVIYGR